MKKLSTIIYTALLMLSSIVASATTPTIASSNVFFQTTEGNSFSMTWTNGNGAKRIVIARKDLAVTAQPTNGVDYLASTTFGLGNELSTGQFVVFDGNGNTTSINGLQPSSIYHFTIFEYNGSGFSTEYLTASTLASSRTTLSAPTTASSLITFSNVNGNSMKLSWANGNGNGRIVLAKAGSPVNVNPNNLTAYTASNVFGSGEEIGGGNFVVFKGNANNLTLTGLQPNTTYYFSVFEFNGNTGPVYFASNPAVANQITNVRPSSVATNMLFANVEGNSMNVSWTSGNGSRRIVIAKAGSAVTAAPFDGIAYAANNNFGLGQEIAAGEFVVYDGTASSFSLRNLWQNTTFHLAVFEYDGLNNTSAYLRTTFLVNSRSTLLTPTMASSALTFSNVGTNSMTLNWTNGNGTNRLVVARANSAVNEQPTNYTAYSPSAAFGSGTQIGTGNYVVYKGTGSSVTVSNLAFNTNYHFEIIEFNGSTGPVYLTTSTAVGNSSTNNTPTVAASNFFVTNTEGNSIACNWLNGNGARRIVVARKGSAVTAWPMNASTYTASNSFGAGTELATGQFVVYDGSGSSMNISNLAIGSTYHFAIFEYNGTGINSNYLTANFLNGNGNTLSAPTTQASGITFSNVTGHSVQVNWTMGNGTRRLLLVKQANVVDAAPQQLATYAPSTSFGIGAQIGVGNYVIYSANSNQVTVNNIQPNTTYHFALYEYNGSAGPVYQTTSPAVANQLTTIRPSIASSNIVVSNIEANGMTLAWANGNGLKRIVVAKLGSPVTSAPTDGSTYNASNVFGTGDEIAPGEFVLMNGSNSSVSLQGLAIGANYHFAIFEYEGTGATTAYLTSSFAMANRTTAAIPTVPSSNLLFTSVGNSSMILNWTNGDGAQRIVIAKKSSPVNVNPTNLVSYVQSPTFGLGAHLGNENYVVYRGSGSSVSIINLLAGTTYYFAVYEFNGSGAPAYLTSSFATGNATTIGAPSVQATNAIIANTYSTSVNIAWTNGSGQKRIVLAKQGSDVDAFPVDNLNYMANSFLGSGDQIGSGNFVVYNGTGNTVTITNLSPQTVYHFAVFEYNDFGATKMYLITSPAKVNSLTATLPVKLLDFTGAIKNGAAILTWATASERNAKWFEVERSKDGHSFVSIDRVVASGNSVSTKAYSRIDHSVVSGQYFYRLKLIDVDGQFAYSKVISVTIKGEVQYRLLENPVREKLIVLNSQPTSSHFTLQVMDMNGRLMMQKNVEAITTMEMDISQLPANMYVLLLSSATEKVQLPFVKMN
jgi:predicted heme/steroid binding protein